MHREIVGQDLAVKAIVQTMQRLRAGLSKRGKPAGVFLFAGPTGVGKTLTAKILAKIYFGSPDKMLRFDMSEYQDIESLDRFLGSLRINEPGQLASQVRDNPFSLILLDEIEKAHKNILNIFLSIFDEGQMTDVFGRKVSFEQNIIIATSNASADLIRDMVNQGLDPSAQKEKIIDALINGHYFSPELLNRFDEIVIFHPLSQQQVHQIAELLVGKLSDRLREQGYFFKPTPEIIDFVALKGFDPQFGARPMQRVIQSKLEALIARKIIENTIQKGIEFSLKAEELDDKITS
jgi:ATP-dependent Clp protease ATP-binding subunit ClpC